MKGAARLLAARTALLALAAAMACDARVEARGGRSLSRVGMDALWDDGKAEMAIYSGTTLRYGRPRPTTARLVIVKEDLHRGSLVKSERGPVPGRTVEALKIVSIAEFPTGSYFYRQVATTFVERATLAPLKENMSHFDGCGLTYVRVGPRQGRWVHETHSYWEGEADRELPLGWPAGDWTLYEALPLSLRERVARRDASTETVWLLPSQISGHAPSTAARPVRAELRIGAPETIRVPAGRFSARPVVVRAPAVADTFWFDTRFPHVLLRTGTQAGRRLVLERTLRLDYWNHKDPEDVALTR